MSKTRGEGRSSSEKSARIIDTKARTRRKKLREEEQEWANRSGPVETRKIDE